MVARWVFDRSRVVSRPNSVRALAARPARVVVAEGLGGWMECDENGFSLRRSPGVESCAPQLVKKMEIPVNGEVPRCAVTSLFQSSRWRSLLWRSRSRDQNA